MSTTEYCYYFLISKAMAFYLKSWFKCAHYQLMGLFESWYYYLIFASVHQNAIIVSVECLTNPCVNGECIEKHNDRECECPPSYTGDDCEIAINRCAGDPCGDNAECIEDFPNQRFVCLCNTGYKPSKRLLFLLKEIFLTTISLLQQLWS